MRRKSPTFSTLCAVLLTSTILTYFTLYKKNNLLALETEKPSRKWPQSATSKVLTGKYRVTQVKPDFLKYLVHFYSLT